MRTFLLIIMWFSSNRIVTVQRWASWTVIILHNIFLKLHNSHLWGVGHVVPWNFSCIQTRETIYGENARMIGFDSIDKGVMLLQKSICPTDVYQVNDLIASTSNSGLNWVEAPETTTNLRIRFSNSQKMGVGVWYMMIGNTLLEIKED